MNTYKIKPKKNTKLQTQDPNDKSYFNMSKKEGITKLGELNSRLEKLQELLYAEQKRKILIVLQAMDTGGKDGVIRHVFDGVNPQGVRVASFKAPTSIELAHDYLWRIHQQVPGKGEIVIFNRSHYEDVLVVRVHNLVDKDVWKKRFDHINEFERMLSDEGTIILKFFLHISFDEQRERLIDRIDKPDKNWKFNPGDLDERALWDDYMQAYEDVINKTSTNWAPWYVIPADRKWYRNLVISQILVDLLENLDMKYPESKDDLSIYRVKLENPQNNKNQDTANS